MNVNIMSEMIYITLFLLPFLNLRIGVTLAYRYAIILVFILCILSNHGKIYIAKELRIIAPYMSITVLLIARHFDINYLIFLFTDIVFPIYVGFYLTRYEKDEDKFIRCLIVSCVTAAIFGVIETITGTNIMDKVYGLETVRWAANDYRLGIPRAYGNFGHSISFCCYLSLIQYLCLYMIFAKRRTKYWYPYILIFVESILTLSRGPIFFNVLVQMFFFYKQKILAKKRCLFVILILIVGGIFFLINNDIVLIIIAAIGVFFNPDKYSALAGTMGFGSAGQRMQLFTWIWERTRGHLLTGNGYGTEFSVVVNEYGDTKTSIENYYLSYFFTYGLAGLISTLGLFFALLKKFKPEKLLMSDLKGKKNFDLYIFLICLFYFPTLLTVSMGREGIFFFLIVGIGMAGIMKSTETFLVGCKQINVMGEVLYK